MMAAKAAILKEDVVPDGAEARLTEIEVDEISFVDRAANRRKFLLVKRGEPMTKPKDTDRSDAKKDLPTNAPADKQDVTLPTPVKEALIRITTEALERLVSIGDLIKEAQETAEQLDTPLPAEMAAEIKGIAELLSGTLSRYPSPVSSDLSEDQLTLAKLAEVAVGLSKADSIIDGVDQLAELAMISTNLHVRAAKSAADNAEKGIDTDTGKAALAVVELGMISDMVWNARSLIEENGEITEEAKGVITRIAAVASEILSGGGVAAAKTEGETPPDTAHVDFDAMSDEEFDTEFEKAIGEIGGLGSEFSDKMRVLAQAMMRIADAPDPISLNNIRHEMIGLAKAAKVAAVKVGQPPEEPVAAPSDEPEVVPTPEETPTAKGEDVVSPAPEEAPSASDPIAALAKAIESLAADVRELKEARAMEGVPQPPPREGGDMGNIGDGPVDDHTVAAGATGEMADVMKALTALSTKVNKMADSPAPPASRPEEVPVHPGDDGKPDPNKGKTRWIIT